MHIIGCHGLLPAQAAAVQETITVTLLDISALDQDVQRLKAALKELNSKRTALRSFANSHKSLLSPVARLPVEVLLQIFQQCIAVPWLVGEKTPYGSSLDKTPLMIASVNRQWRKVALSTPKLWASFNLELRPKDMKRHVELANMWLSRSGHSLLSIHLSSRKDFRDPMRKLMQIFASHSERWRNIYLMLPLPLLHSLSLVKNRLANLELLQFDFCNHGNRPLLVEPIDIFAHAPRLQDFSAGVNVDRASLHIPWSQLRTIKSLSDDHSPQSMLNLLKTAPYIERCRMKIEGNTSGPSLTPGQAPGSVQLSNLRYLTAVFESEDPTSFFTILDIPNIRELSLATDMGWGPLISTLTSICSQPSLEKLALMSMMWYDSPDVSDGLEDSDDSGDTNDTNDTDDSDDSDDSDEFNKALFRRLRGNDLMQILKAAKHVRELEVPECNPRFFTAAFMKRFGQLRSSGTPILCPNLQKLLFRYSEKMDLEPLGKALLSRCSSTSHPTLRDVVVLCWDAKRASITKALQSSSWWIKLRDVGIDMRVSRFENYEQWW
ncbi:hypothetical protein HWV62_35644 [Athelia sp. TMB]|nr:hypothetical protein HWV62_35644 [Athelia sp. TMB]